MSRENVSLLLTFKLNDMRQSKTIWDNEGDLRKLGAFFDTKEGVRAFKCGKGNKYYWMKKETYGEWIKRIIGDITN